MKVVFMKSILILSLIIYSVSDYGKVDYMGLAKCPDDKTKTKACAFIHSEGTNVQFLIFDKCGKGKKCDYKDTNMCIPTVNKRKNGQSCNYNEDCLSGSCISGECGGLGEGQDCSGTSGIGRKACGSGLYCTSYTESSTTKYKCSKAILSVGTQVTETSTCGIGYLPDKDGKCQKFGSIADGSELGDADDKLCQSGYSHSLASDSSKTICDSITTEPTCKSDHSLEGGKWKNGDSIAGDCDQYTLSDSTSKDYNPYITLKSTLYQEFLEEYEDLDLEEINTDDKYGGFYIKENLDFNNNNLKWKVYKKYLLYEHAEELLATGLIDKEGEIADDKDCEYNFILKNVLSSKYHIISFALLALFSLLL